MVRFKWFAVIYNQLKLTLFIIYDIHKFMVRFNWFAVICMSHCMLFYISAEEYSAGAATGCSTSSAKQHNLPSILALLCLVYAILSS